MKTAFKISISLLLFSLLPVTTQASTDKIWRFKVFLDDSEIGYHTVRVTPRDDMTLVNIEANFNVNFLFITAYSYQHTNREIWKDGCLHEIHSETNDNGEQMFVLGKKRSDLINLTTTDKKIQLDGCIKSFAYWLPDFLDSQRLLNAQTGEIVEVDITPVGEELISVKGEKVLSDRYRIVAEDFTIELWYSKNNEWLALNSTTSDGASLRYQAQ